jgi:hypothetical protein
MSLWKHNTHIGDPDVIQREQHGRNFGFRTAFKEDLQASVAELVYGEPLRIPGELPTPSQQPHQLQ